MSRWHGLYPKKHRAPRWLSLILRRTVGGGVVNEHGRASRGIGFSSGSVDEQLRSETDGDLLGCVVFSAAPRMLEVTTSLLNPFGQGPGGTTNFLYPTDREIYSGSRMT